METGTEHTQGAAEADPATPAPNGAGTLSGEVLRDVSGGGEDPGEVTPAAAVKAAAAGQSLTPEGQSEALKWYLSNTPDAATTEVKEKTLNFGTSDEPTWVHWKVRPIGLDVLRTIRKRAAQSREARRTGAADEYRVNLEIVVAGTVDPDLHDASRIIHERGLGPNDPVENLRARFQGKPGYITQLAGEILGMSGFNEDDMQDADALEAAKNS